MTKRQNLLKKQMTEKYQRTEHAINVYALCITNIVKILNLYIILLCTHLYHPSFQHLSITRNAFMLVTIVSSKLTNENWANIRFKIVKFFFFALWFFVFLVLWPFFWSSDFLFIRSSGFGLLTQLYPVLIRVQTQD